MKVILRAACTPRARGKCLAAVNGRVLEKREIFIKPLGEKAPLLLLLVGTYINCTFVFNEYLPNVQWQKVSSREGREIPKFLFDVVYNVPSCIIYRWYTST